MIASIKDIILQNHRSFIALNKPATMASVPDQSQDECLLDLAERYCRKKLYPVHRLDRPVSGVQLFAKSNKMHNYFLDLMKSKQWSKEYLVLVKNKPKDESASLEHFLKRDGKRHKSLIMPSEIDAKKAISEYEYLFSLENYHVLKVKLVTGRFHQIRSQLAAIGSPVKGDVKYGARRKNPDRSINLHSWRMEFSLKNIPEPIQLLAELPNEPIWNAVKDGLAKL